MRGEFQNFATILNNENYQKSQQKLLFNKNITKETYFDELKENLNSGELKYLNNFYKLQENLKGQGIFENFKVQPIKFMYHEIYKMLTYPYKHLKQCSKMMLKLKVCIFSSLRIQLMEQITLLNENSIYYHFQELQIYLNQEQCADILKQCNNFVMDFIKNWYISSRKNIIQYELAKDLANKNENLKYFQTAAQTLKQKLRANIDIVLNLINWNNLHEQIETDQIEINVYRPLIMMLRLFNKYQQVCYHYEILDQFCITQLAKNVKQKTLDYLNKELIPLGFKQMKQLYQQVLQAPEFYFINEIHPGKSLSELLTILVQALYFHGWMTQVFTIYNEILKKFKKQKFHIQKRELQIFDQKQYNDLIKQANKHIYKMNDFFKRKTLKTS